MAYGYGGWAALRSGRRAPPQGRARDGEAAQEGPARLAGQDRGPHDRHARSGARRGARTWRAIAITRTACRAAAPTSATARSSIFRSRRGKVTALVSGSELYTVNISIKPLPRPQWQSSVPDCAGGIDSLVELLQGRFSKGVMERLCRQDNGLFPKPSEIRFSCSCPDFASMCKHVAAVLYGVGARLDEQPELLFRLRAVDHNELVADLDTAVPLSKTAPVAGRVLETEDISALFGLDMAEEESPTQPGDEAPPELKPPTRGKQPRASKKAAVRTKGGTRQETAARKEAASEAIEHPSAKSVRATPDAGQRPRRRKPGAVWDPADIYEA